MIQFRLARRLLPIALLVSITAAAPTEAQTIYRCEQGGRTTYTDAPCARPTIRREEPSAPSPTAAAKQTVVGGGYENPYGPWHGEAQYQVKNVGLREDGTHSVVPLTLDISEDGKVTGVSAENGCQMLGIATPGFTPKILNLDTTVSKCAAKKMNRRYHGSLSIDSKDRTARLNLNTLQIGIGVGVFGEIKAVMRR